MSDEPIELGRLPSLPIGEYHNGKCISHSSLEVFRERPQLYYRKFIAKTIPRTETPAMRIGSALHCAVFEPDTYASRYVVKPQGIDRRTTAGKAAFAAFEAEVGDKTILDADESALVYNMTRAVMGNKSAAQLLAKGDAEVTWRAKSSSLPYPLQCRTDWFNAEGCELSGGRPYILDVKTTASLDARSIRFLDRTFADWGYHRQIGFYVPLLYDCGVTCSDAFFVVVEKEEPFGCIVYRMSDAAIARGQDETISDLQRLSRCFKTDTWPNLTEDIAEIGLPEYYDK